MRKSRYTEEQIIKVLKEHAAGLSASEVCRKYGISDATFYKWRSRYGGMEISDARKLKALEDENRKLKKLLIGGLRRHEPPRWSLHRLGDRLRVAEVVLLSLRIRANVLRRHQPGFVTKTLELATEMMCPDASLHPDQAGRHVGKP
jgi:putative transposase